MKPIRDIQALLQREEDLQRLESLAIDEAREQERMAQEQEQNDWATSAPTVELCSTAELMEVFTEFYEGDKQDMLESDRVVSSVNIEADVDVKASEFDLEFEGASASEFSLPNIDFGTNIDSYNLEDLL